MLFIKTNTVRHTLYFVLRTRRPQLCCFFVFDKYKSNNFFNMHSLLREVEIRRRSLYYNNIIVLPEFWTCSCRNETSFRRHYSYNVITIFVRVRQTIWIEKVFEEIKYTHEKNIPYAELSYETSLLASHPKNGWDALEKGVHG